RHGFRGGVARPFAVEQGKAGRAGAGHSNEPRPGLRGQPPEHGSDLRHESNRRPLKVVPSLAPVTQGTKIVAVPADENLSRRKRYTRIHEKNGRSGDVRQGDGRKLVARTFSSDGQTQQTGRDVAPQIRSDVLGPLRIDLPQ